MIDQPQNTIKPFLRWAGGKSWLIKYIDNFLPSVIQNYYEPFLGGGAIYYYIKQSHKIKGNIILSDSNKELINCYTQVRDNVEDIIEFLQNYKNEKDFYYQMRRMIPKSKTERASRFIFLNKTSFNGIYRVNLNGEYNVPFGYKKGKTSYEYDNLRKASELLKNAEFIARDFQKSFLKLKKNDLIVLDPPYTVAHGNNGFIQYNQKIFAWKDQERLAKSIGLVMERGSFYMLTNAKHESIRLLFGKENEPVIVSRASTIAGKNSSRGVIEEYVFSNVVQRQVSKWKDL